MTILAKIHCSLKYIIMKILSWKRFLVVAYYFTSFISLRTMFNRWSTCRPEHRPQSSRRIRCCQASMQVWSISDTVDTLLSLLPVFVDQSVEMFLLLNFPSSEIPWMLIFLFVLFSEFNCWFWSNYSTSIFK